MENGQAGFKGEETLQGGSLRLARFCSVAG